MKNFLISLKRVFKRVLNNDFQRLVSSLSFQTALSIVPVIGLYVWIIHNIGILDNLLPMIRATLLEYLAPTAAETLERQLNNAINKTSENITGIISLILILIIGFRTFEDLRQGLKAITNEDMNNSLWQRILTFIFVITLSPLLVLIIAFATWLASFFDFILIINFTSLIPWTIFITLFYGWGLFNKLIWYKYTLVALIVSICILFADQLLLVLAKNVLTYNKIYGSLSFLPIFLLWLMILWYLILTGFVVLCEFAKDTKKSNNIKSEL